MSAGQYPSPCWTGALMSSLPRSTVLLNSKIPICSTAPHHSAVCSSVKMAHHGHGWMVPPFALGGLGGLWTVALISRRPNVSHSLSPLNPLPNPAIQTKLSLTRKRLVENHIAEQRLREHEAGWIVYYDDQPLFELAFIRAVATRLAEAAGQCFR